MIDIQTFIMSLVATGIATPTIAWGLLGKLVDSRLSTKLEIYKAELQRDALEHDVRFRDLHAKRAEVIVELHDKLQTFYLALESYTTALEMTSEPSKDEKFEKVAEANDILIPIFLRNRIFLSETTDAMVESLANKMRAVARDFRRVLSGRSKEKDWDEVADRVQEELKPVLSQLRTDFRAILGVERDSRSQNSLTHGKSQHQIEICNHTFKDKNE